MINKKYFRLSAAKPADIPLTIRAIEALDQAIQLITDVSTIHSHGMKTHDHSVKLGELRHKIEIERVIFDDHLYELRRAFKEKAE